MSNKPESDATEQWIRDQMESAVQELSDLGAVGSEMTEARPIWSLPQKLVLGQIRDADDHASAKWFVCGEFKTDFININLATAPRDALRHFSLKWQMEAERNTDSAVAERLIQRAEELYDIVEADSLWSDAPA